MSAVQVCVRCAARWPVVGAPAQWCPGCRGVLLSPTRLYLEEVRRLRASCDVRALAHVTGGGIMGNLPRVLPGGVGVELDWGSWERPPVYAWLDEQGVSEEEQRRVFNLGIGMCAVVPKADAAAGLVIGRLA